MLEPIQKLLDEKMKEDPELLGGFILLVDGKEYDYSMAGRLNRLEQTLMRR